MSYRSRLGAILIILGLVSVFLPFTREFALISVFLVAFGATSIVREFRGKDRLLAISSARCAALPSPRRGRSPGSIPSSPCASSSSPNPELGSSR